MKSMFVNTLTSRAGAWLIALCLVLITAGRIAQAQTAPDGNAHPKMGQVAANAEQIANPFGDIMRTSGYSSAEKAQFAHGINLEPLRSLSVFHGGRLKVLDTLSRETVSTLCNRKDYFEIDANGKKVSFDPLFTTIDMMIDPAYYADKPLVYINFLPLREAILEAEFPKDPAKVDEWKKKLRVTPIMFNTHARTVGAKHTDQQFTDGLGRADAALRLWHSGWSNLDVVPPPVSKDPWKHLSTLEPTHPARAAALALGESWRRKDGVNAQKAIDALAAALPAISPNVYPTTQRTIEVSYNRSRGFDLGWIAYALSFLMLILAFGTGRSWLMKGGIAMFVVAILIHALAFGMRSYLAQRYAIQNQFESMTGISLFAAVVGLVLMAWRKQPLFGAAAAGAGFLALVGATQTGIPGYNIEREAAILNTSVLLKYHVTIVLVSYSLITLGFLISCFFLVTHYSAKSKGTLPAVAVAGVGGVVGMNADACDATSAADDAPAAPGTIAKTLKDLDTAQMTVLQLAFWFLGVGILLGGWWADHSWGRWWAFDPKETWALITWIVYLILIHVRFATGKNRSLISAWLSVVGFFTMLWCYFGVNLILPGLHAYA
ncbi:MAG: cytochrome c biogenesis protein CcsA [Planctomycetes bacterium]|nr:cytochrome c biogenesis protein CcsA [Planctomycetota bacterium]